VFPSNEGRGYVLRRILRRAVRHAWLLGRKEPTLVDVVQSVIDTMHDVYPELKARTKHILETTRVEEQGFLTTIEGGLSRFEQLAPTLTASGSLDLHGTISGEDAFRLYDTFGFPIDLTELMARERGYTVDIAGFEAALQGQRSRSQAERKAKRITVDTDVLADISQWELPPGERSAEGSFVGYDAVEIETQVTAVRHLSDGRVAVLLRESPFYAESGGQISDRGEITGDGWRVEVDDVRKIDGRPAAVGPLTGTFRFGRVTARVPSERRRETERNHTATHLLHAALRQVLGEAVHQAGSLVAPERLRFDFTHHGLVKRERLDEIEAIVNQEIWRAIPVTTDEMAYQEARDAGAMALFGEKYGDVVRVVKIPGFSMELCGGTHVRNTAQIGFFKIVSETGVAAGVRRIEAVTGPGAYDFVRGEERLLHRVADALRVPAEQVDRRVSQLLEERRALERRIEEAMRGGGDQLQTLLEKSVSVGTNGVRYVSGTVRAGDVRELQVFGDALRERIGSGVGVVGSKFADGKGGIIVIVSDDLREKGIRADSLIKEIAAAAGGRGGGKAHMAQAGLPDADRFEEAAQRGLELVGSALSDSG
jgi:alanyl-tRNA synthetase